MMVISNSLYGFKKFFPLLTKNAIVNEMRSKTLIILLLFSIFTAVAFYHAMNFLRVQLGQMIPFSFLSSTPLQLQVYVDLLSIWGDALALYLGARCIQSDKKGKVLEQILALPLHRNIFILTRIFGTFLVILSQYLLSTLLATFIFSSSNFKGIPFGQIFTTMGLYCSNYITLITLGIFLSFFFSKWVSFFIGMIFWFFCVSGQISVEQMSLVEALHSSGTTMFSKFLQLAFPNLGVAYQYTFKAIRGTDLGSIHFLPIVGHYILTYLLFLLFTLFVWNKKEVITTM